MTPNLALPAVHLAQSGPLARVRPRSGDDLFGLVPVAHF